MASRQSAESKEKYGFFWEPYQTDISIEMAAIQLGGHWEDTLTGVTCGIGLKGHMKNFISLLWPHYLWHKWNDLQLETWCKYRIIGTMGPASSGKTNAAAVFALADYYVFPDCTTVLVSSTEREMLEMRVWGEMKSYHNKAKALHPGVVVGRLIESRQRIVTDERHAFVEDGRDFRNGVLGVPLKKGGNYQGLGCFPANTLVDTPTGPQFIQSIKVGDLVRNATGVGRVRSTMIRSASNLVRVHYQGRHFDCTPEHPILTNFGWVEAIDLSSKHLLVSSREAVQILRQGTDWRQETQGILLQELQVERSLQAALLPSVLSGIPEAYPWQKEVLLEGVPDEVVEQGLQAMRGKLSTIRAARSFLQSVLRSELEGEPAGNTSQDAGRSRSHIGGTQNQPLSPEEQEIYCSVKEAFQGEERAEDSAREAHPQNVPRSQLQHCYRPRSAGPDLAGHQTGRGDRWIAPSLRPASGVGPAEGINPGFLRVDGIEVFKRTSPGGARAGQIDYRVYNLEVEGHPSYSVNGILVHNSLVGIKNKRVRLIADELSLCPRIFIDAISNLNKNPEFKCVGIGNPKDTTDALGLLCEPSAEDGGWDSGIDQTPVTKVWRTRFDNGVCIQLPGSDCPNMDVAEGEPPPYPFLITRESIESDRRFYGEDSLWFSMMNQGRMPRGQGLRRVITRQMALKFQAMDRAVWMNEEHTKIGFMDAAYGAVGGDRCIFGELWFGADPNDKQQVEVQDVQLVPVSVLEPDMPEDQIAKWVKDQCQLRKIPPENFFFDSTGRGTLVGAFARLWDPNVGLVEFGGNASDDRMVSDGIKILCKDYYFNFVTQLWFQVAMCVQAGQFRGLTEELLTEGSMREWGFAGRNKIQVEPKDKMKLKSGRSPDAFDALVTGVEGALRRGFRIQRLMLSNPTYKADWSSRYADRMTALSGRSSLKY